MKLQKDIREFIDLLTGLSGITWDQAWKSRQVIELDGLTIQVVGREALIANKKATGRIQDLADVERLERGGLSGRRCWEGRKRR